jgi:hypothetical protein
MALGPMVRQIQSYDRSLWAAILFYDPGASWTTGHHFCPLPAGIQNHSNFVDILIRSRDIREKPRAKLPWSSPMAIKIPLCAWMLKVILEAWEKHRWRAPEEAGKKESDRMSRFQVPLEKKSDLDSEIFSGKKDLLTLLRKVVTNTSDA